MNGKWMQDNTVSTMAHFFIDEEAACGQRVRTGAKLYDGGGRYDFTGFCAECSIKTEGFYIPSWAIKQSTGLPI